MGWRSEPVTDLEGWVLQYAARRYNAKNLTSGLTTAWTNLLHGAYQYHSSSRIKAMIDKAPTFSMPYYSEQSATNIAVAWGALLNDAVNGNLDRSVQPLQYDIVDFGRQVLVNLFVDLHAMYNASYFQYVEKGVNTSVQLEGISTAMIDLIYGVDLLLGTNTNFLLGHWIADARASVPSTSPPEAVDNAEFNARNQITMWGPHQEVEDYASKEWSGLVNDYYAERWSLFTTLVNQAVREGKTFDNDDYESKRFILEQKFSYTIKSYPTTPRGNAVDYAFFYWGLYVFSDAFQYISYEDTDIPGFDILPYPTWTRDIGQLKYLCNSHPDCIGFNDKGQLKSSLKGLMYTEGTTFYEKFIPNKEDK